MTIKDSIEKETEIQDKVQKAVKNDPYESDYEVNTHVYSKKELLVHNIFRVLNSVRFIIFAVVCGVVLGIIGGLFAIAISLVTDFRLNHGFMIYFLPIGSILILLIYHLAGVDKDEGTNLVLDGIRRKKKVPFKMAPLIFIATVLSHLIGASVGREGAALQIGGSVGRSLGKPFKSSDNDDHIMIMAGMAACFSALFGTPLAAAIFSIEVTAIGIMDYASLVPCVIASLTAHVTAKAIGASPAVYDIGNLSNEFHIMLGLKLSVLALLSGLISMLFILALRYASRISIRLFSNPYLRAFVCGLTVLVLSLLEGHQTYNGAGGGYIAACFSGECSTFGWILKIIFTAISIAAGYKGGEIVPSFFIGASFGCFYGNLTGTDPALCTAVGMVSVFCGVTNCPVASFIIGLELFGFKAAPYFLLASALSYLVSGYYGLYTSQRIVFSKYVPRYMNKKTR